MSYHALAAPLGEGRRPLASGEETVLHMDSDAWHLEGTMHNTSVVGVVHRTLVLIQGFPGIGHFRCAGRWIWHSSMVLECAPMWMRTPWGRWRAWSANREHARPWEAARKWAQGGSLKAPLLPNRCAASALGAAASGGGGGARRQAPRRAGDARLAEPKVDGD